MKSNTVELTIGMPVYNGELFIDESIRSLLSQTYADFKLIISDNASNDRTEEICRRYARSDNRITYIRQSTNIGGAANFMYLAGLCQSRYFMWAAADDKWDDAWIETLLPIAKQYNSLAFGTVQQIDRNSKYLEHTANLRNFEYRGSKIYRRFKYLIHNPRHGKANPIYSIIPREFLDGTCFEPFMLPVSNVDNLFLYNLLDTAQIRCDQSVRLYKRIVESNPDYLVANPAPSDTPNVQTARSVTISRVISTILEIQKAANGRFLVYLKVDNDMLETLGCYILTSAFLLRELTFSALRFLFPPL